MLRSTELFLWRGEHYYMVARAADVSTAVFGDTAIFSTPCGWHVPYEQVCQFLGKPIISKLDWFRRNNDDQQYGISMELVVSSNAQPRCDTDGGLQVPLFSPGRIPLAITYSDYNGWELVLTRTVREVFANRSGSHDLCWDVAQDILGNELMLKMLRTVHDEQLGRRYQCGVRVAVLAEIQFELDPQIWVSAWD